MNTTGVLLSLYIFGKYLIFFKQNDSFLQKYTI